ncbi:MAG TPA: zinc ABC transporter substrate-binding protein [Marinagarivorans sp.]
MTVLDVNGSAIRVVTSFSILEDLVRELGGDYVSVVNLVGRNSDAHMYQPKPSDAVAVAQADLVIVNGLGFEGWIARLIENCGYQGQSLIASKGIEVLFHGDEPDPHAWQSFRNIRVYIHNITQALIAQRPQYAQAFLQRQRQYLNAVELIEQELIAQLAKVPASERMVVTSHDAFGYLGHEFSIAFISPVGLSTDAEASAADVATIIKQIKKHRVKAIFMENINNPRLLQRIAAETDIAVGGKLYSDALSDVHDPAGTYLTMMQHNVMSLIAAFTEP